MSLASDVEKHLLETWAVKNFAQGMHGENGHDPELLNWRIASIDDHGQGGILLHLNVLHGSASREQVRLLSWRVMTLSTGTFSGLEQATVMTMDEQIAESTRRSDLPRAPGIGTA